MTPQPFGQGPTTIRGRIWRDQLAPTWDPHVTRWHYEVRAGGRLLTRATTATHQSAITRVCRLVHLARLDNGWLNIANQDKLHIGNKSQHPLNTR